LNRLCIVVVRSLSWLLFPVALDYTALGIDGH